VRHYSSIPLDEAQDYLNKFILVGMPTYQQGQALLVTATVVDPNADGSGVVDVARLTEAWKEKRWFITEASIPKNDIEQQGFSRLAVCERLDDKLFKEPIYINDIVLHHSFIVLPFTNEKTYLGHGDFKEEDYALYWHCPVCVQNAVNWLYDNQEAWHAQAGSRSVQEAASALN
jgi:hypothetical protein